MKKRILVAMSGGVDSSLTAALLKEEGWEVIGITLRLWKKPPVVSSKKPSCCTPETLADAQEVCDFLGVPHYLSDSSDVFQEKVIDEFVDTYQKGMTPNPCVTCNQFIKFSLLYPKMIALDAPFMATGHYARIIEGPRLLKAVDEEKDQSYFLYSMPKKFLSMCKFPLGGMRKEEVRRKAKALGIPSAEKPESQDICFVGGGKYSDYLEKNGIHPMPGEIVDVEGKVLGRHEGIHRFTIGQRQGIGVAAPEAVYVSGIRVKENQVVVSKRSGLERDSVRVKILSWLSPDFPQEDEGFSVKLRYGHKGVMASIFFEKEEGIISIKFKQPVFAPCPGQSAVIYRGEEVVGGGTILYEI